MKYKNVLTTILAVILFPLWFPFVLFFFPFAMAGFEKYDEDLKWCDEHGVPYPNVPLFGHRVVEDWRKEEAKKMKENNV